MENAKKVGDTYLKFELSEINKTSNTLNKIGTEIKKQEVKKSGNN